MDFYQKDGGRDMDKKQQNHARILIADDEPIIREVLYRKLIAAGFTCYKAVDGNDAMQQLGSYIIDLILLDINMPGKSGIDVLKQSQEKYPDVAVIMVTSMSEIETAINAMKLGASDYLIKPIDQKLLLMSIERALERRELIVENKNYQHDLEKRVEEQTGKIRDSFLNSIKSLAYALEAKDEYTSGHSERTTEIAVSIATKLALPKQVIEKIRLAGLLHDIGKIGVKESVLNKSGDLTDEEYNHVKKHSELGERILSPVVDDVEILEMVRHHHEHYDGTGYPDGLRAEQISKGARILAVADSYHRDLSLGSSILAVSDAYDAMTSSRPYREAMTPQLARAHLKANRGTQFDPEIVDILFALLDEGKIK
jgi:putative two-component system response regulator